LVRHEPYGRVELTSQGRQMAEELYRRHETLITFLSRFLGLEESVAENDACHMEHVLSPEALNRIVKFLRFLEVCPADEPRCLDAFGYYMATNSLPDFCFQVCGNRGDEGTGSHLPSQVTGQGGVS
jgi:DtxR family Mn-dependent transcriptional regulator